MYMLLVGSDKAIYSLDESGKKTKLCVMEAPNKLKLTNGARLTLGSATRCLCLMQS